MLRPVAHAEDYGYQPQQSYPRARNNKAAEETQKANEDERGEAQELTRNDVPEVELFICLREEEHQDKDVVNVCGREGDGGCDERGENLLHQAIIQSASFSRAPFASLSLR